MAQPIEIEIWLGDIAELEVDAVIVPANETLFMTAPVAAAVKRAAGDDVEREAVGHGPVSAGSAVVTNGGRLAAPYVIHAVGVGHDLRADPDRLREAVAAALDAVEHLALRRVAMAPLGTERGVFAPRDAAGIVIGEIRAHADRGSAHPDSVVIAVTRPGELVEFRTALDQVRLPSLRMPPAEGR